MISTHRSDSVSLSNYEQSGNPTSTFMRWCRQRCKAKRLRERESACALGRNPHCRSNPSNPKRFSLAAGPRVQRYARAPHGYAIMRSSEVLCTAEECTSAAQNPQRSSGPVSSECQSRRGAKMTNQRRQELFVGLAFGGALNWLIALVPPRWPDLTTPLEQRRQHRLDPTCRHGGEPCDEDDRTSTTSIPVAVAGEPYAHRRPLCVAICEGVSCTKYVPAQRTAKD
jgi:hypothetical protein